MQPFSDLLKTCLELTHTKLNVLSKEVGYDPSYLSRFSNGKLLPKGVAALKLCEDLGSFFAKQIMILDELDIALSILNLDQIKNEDQLRQQLSLAFKEAYHQSHSIPNKKSKVVHGQQVMDVVSFVLELQKYEKSTMTISLPNALYNKLEKTLSLHNVQEKEHHYYFIYIENTCYYGLQYFEDFQKLIVNRLQNSQDLKQCELLLDLI